MTFWRKQGHLRFRARNEKLNPALLGSERLVRKNFESQFLCIELQCGVLIANRNTGNADSTNHVAPPRETQPNLRSRPLQSARECYSNGRYRNDLCRRL